MFVKTNLVLNNAAYFEIITLNIGALQAQLWVIFEVSNSLRVQAKVYTGRYNCKGTIWRINYLEKVSALEATDDKTAGQ